jgi:hypothetical protein
MNVGIDINDNSPVADGGYVGSFFCIDLTKQNEIYIL